jgi:hypothetical protein
MSINFQNLNPRNRQPGATRLGLAFDTGRLEVVEVRRTNGSVEITRSFTVTLSLDPLTNAPELVGREIRKALDEHGIRERWCAVCIPLNWALTLTTKLPPLGAEDIASFLQVEAERGFPYGPEALVTRNSRFNAGADAWATLIGVPLGHVTRLEEVLAAAQLRPVAFSLAIAALQPADQAASDGVLALVPGANNIRVQLTLGGGIAVLRTIEGAFELNGADREMQADHIAREVRITLGQLAPELREAVKLVRVLGKGDDADELAEVLGPRLQAQGLKFEHERTHRPDDFAFKLPAQTAISPALALAMRHLAKGGIDLDFLPPKVSAWQQFSSKYSSPRLVTAGAVGAVAAALVLLAFVVQQSLLWYWGHRWHTIERRVQVLEDTQANIRKFRPWYDASYRELSILRRLTEAFPEDGTVSAKQIAIRDAGKPGEPLIVTCTGSARSRSALAKVKEKLRSGGNIKEIEDGPERGTAPIEFEFKLTWSEGQ